MKYSVLLLALLLQICHAADPAPAAGAAAAPAAPADPAVAGAVTTPTTLAAAAGGAGAATTPTTPAGAAAAGAVTTPTTPAAGAATTPTTTPAGATTPTTPTPGAKTTPTTTGKATTPITTPTPGKATTPTTTPTTELPENPATMDVSQLSQYSLTVTMNADQLAAFRATHTEPQTTTTLPGGGPGAAGARVAPGATPQAQNSADTLNDDTTKGLTFVTSRVLRSTAAAVTQAEADASADPSESDLGDSSTSATTKNGGYLNSANSLLLFVAVFASILGGSFGL